MLDAKLLAVLLKGNSSARQSGELRLRLPNFEHPRKEFALTSQCAFAKQILFISASVWLPILRRS